MSIARFWFFFLFLGLPLSLFAQDPNKKWRLDGYIKEMIYLTALQDVDSLTFDNLIHNRLNFFWYPTEKLTLNTEVRTRMFHGDAVKTIPSYGNFIDVNNDFFDFSYTEDFDQMVFHIRESKNKKDIAKYQSNNLIENLVSEAVIENETVIENNKVFTNFIILSLPKR